MDLLLASASDERWLFSALALFYHMRSDKPIWLLIYIHSGESHAWGMFGDDHILVMLGMTHSALWEDI